MWKDTDHFKNKGGKLMACCVFALKFLLSKDKNLGGCFGEKLINQ